MFYKQAVPEMFIYSRNRNQCFGTVTDCTEFTEDIRFNSCSEVKFKVSKRFYDIETEQWYDNPIYSKLVKNNTICLDDPNSYFKYPNRTIPSSFSCSGASDASKGRDAAATSFNSNTVTDGFQLQSEHLLYNVSCEWGYQWLNFSQIDIDGLIRYPSGVHNNHLWFPYVACKSFIPISPGDVIVAKKAGSKSATGADIRFIDYTAHFYTADNPESYVASYSFGKMAVSRFSLNSYFKTLPDNAQNNEIKKKLANGGYVRFSVVDGWSENYGDTTYASYYNTETKLSAWSFPYNGWLQIYSGERFCKTIPNASREGYYDLPMRWFVITSVNEESDGISSTKSVSAYSYEYTLSQRAISLTSGTLPLYVPEEIVSLIKSDDWVIDKEQSSSTVIRGAQTIKTGVLNQILDLFPSWSIGHISQELMTCYRTFDDVDNANVYSFLMNDVQKAYQCYFVFDNDAKTISAYTQDDIIYDSNIVLSWDDAIKHLQITDSDLAFTTALRGHTADDTYGLGLVNPTGNSTTYNFDSLIDEMDFVADSSDDDPWERNKIDASTYRTLKQAVQEWQQFITSPSYSFTHTFSDNGASLQVSINVTSQIQRNLQAANFIRANMSLIQAQSRLGSCLAEYETVANKITTYLEYDYKDNLSAIPDLLPDGPLTPVQISGMSITDIDSRFHSRGLYEELLAASQNYYQAYTQCYEMIYKSNPANSTQRSLTAYGEYRIYQHVLACIAQRASLNHRYQEELIEAYNSGVTTDEFGDTIQPPVLTLKEIEALQAFIYEGDWTNDNAVFSETYGAEDIMQTLNSVYSQQKEDLDSILSKPSFEFEVDTINWMAIEEMWPQAQQIRLGNTVNLITEDDKWVQPVLLELHINRIDPSDFHMTFTTDYTRKPTQFRFADLYGTITQTSVTDSAFTFDT